MKRKLLSLSQGKMSRANHARLLEELRHLNHQLLSGQENERKKLSGELYDETAQRLMGINVQLLTLKREALENTKRLKKDIACTQQLMEKSARALLRFSVKSSIYPKTARIRK